MTGVDIDCIGDDARASHINNESIMFDGDCFDDRELLLMLLLLLLHLDLWIFFSPIGLDDRWLTFMVVENFFECGDGGKRI